MGWNARGQRIAELGIAQRLVTSVCFGGDGLDTLYVLTGCNADHPDTEGGCIYVASAPCRGLPAPFARVRV